MKLLDDVDRGRRRFGLVLLGSGVVIGTGLFGLLFLAPGLVAPNPVLYYGSMMVGAALAMPAGAVYVSLTRLLDRYDPEPWYALAGCLAWGGIAAVGFSAPVNTCVAVFSEAAGTVLSAPIMEETLKGLGVFGIAYFVRREFDGIVDGVIYAAFVALGFATIENVIYYASAATESAGRLAMTVFVRGVLSPWGHPIFTAMTGVGFGIARETDKRWLRPLAPMIGLAAAITLHALWNGSAVVAQQTGEGGAVLFLLMLPMWLLFVCSFLALVVVLVRRRGRIIREHLLDEVAIGTLSQSELELVCSAFGTWRARRLHGPRGVEFVRAVARLALSKWHAGRAMRAQERTVSFDLVVPLRQRIAALRAGAA